MKKSKSLFDLSKGDQREPNSERSENLLAQPWWKREYISTAQVRKNLDKVKPGHLYTLGISCGKHSICTCNTKQPFDDYIHLLIKNNPQISWVYSIFETAPVRGLHVHAIFYSRKRIDITPSPGIAAEVTKVRTLSHYYTYILKDKPETIWMHKNVWDKKFKYFTIEKKNLYLRYK